MTRILLITLFLACPAAFGQTNYVDAPDGTAYLATSDSGCYWAGFSVGLVFYGFGMILKMSKRTAGYQD
jgi:hypothetical protein